MAGGFIGGVLALFGYQQYQKRKVPLTNEEVNEQIQSKICKVITRDAEGTGFLVDDERGIVWSAFHLNMERAACYLLEKGKNDNTVHVLYVSEYLNFNEDNGKFYLTKKALRVQHAEEIHFEMTARVGTVTNGIDVNLVDKIAVFSEFQRIKRESAKLFVGDFSSQRIEIRHEDETFYGRVHFPDAKSYHSTETIIKNLAYFDVFLIKIENFQNSSLYRRGGATPRLSALPPSPLIVGETVYFGGHPLGQPQYTFSVGIISALTPEDPKKTFTLEAPIVPGNSGSPVFIQRERQLYWIGIITSEIASVSEELQELRTELRKGRKGGISFGSLDPVRCLDELTETLLANLSTGKGKAVQVQTLTEEALFEAKDMMPQQEILRELSNFLVMQKAPSLLPKKMRLFEYINYHRITQLTKGDITK